MRGLKVTLLVLGLAFAYLSFSVWFLSFGDQDSLHQAEVWINHIHDAEKEFQSETKRYSSNIEDLGPHGRGLLDEIYAKRRIGYLALDLTADRFHYEVKIRPQVWFRDGYSSLYLDESGWLRRSDWPWPAGRGSRLWYRLD